MTGLPRTGGVLWPLAVVGGFLVLAGVGLRAVRYNP